MSIFRDEISNLTFFLYWYASQWKQMFSFCRNDENVYTKNDSSYILLSFNSCSNFVHHVDEFFERRYRFFVAHFCLLKLIQNSKSILIRLIDWAKTYQIETLERIHRRSISQAFFLFSQFRFFDSIARFFVFVWSLVSFAQQFVWKRVWRFVKN